MRDPQLIALRPQLDLDTTKATPEEQFQNITLRPILKLQHALLVSIFKHGIAKHRNVYQNLPQKERMLLIAGLVRKDHKMRQLLAGTIIGQFTMEEYSNFQANEPALMRRLIALMVQRLQSVDLKMFDPNAT